MPISPVFGGLNNNSKDNEILRLKDELNKANKIINDQKIMIQNLQYQLNNNINNNNMQYYQNIINQKEQELNNLRLQLIQLQKGKYIDRNKMMAVNFISMDQKLHCAIPCVGTDTFAEVEEELYKKYPEYRETNNNFVANGQTILRFKTISQNNIGEGLPVTMILP